MQTKYKAIIEYILRIGLFLILNRRCIYMFLFTFIAKLLPQNDTLPNDWTFFGLIFVFLTIICSYLIAKISGIFKKLDKLNFILGLIIICLLNCILNISLNFSIQTAPLKITYNPDGGFWYFYPLLFVYYRILNWLGKKFPNTLGKIGYYCSIELYKGLFKRITSKDAKKV